MTNQHRNAFFCAITCSVSLMSLTACKEQPKTTGEKIEDRVKDGLDARPNEKLRDTTEDVKDAVKDVIK